MTFVEVAAALIAEGRQIRALSAATLRAGVVINDLGLRRFQAGTDLEAPQIIAALSRPFVADPRFRGLGAFASDSRFRGLGAFAGRRRFGQPAR